MRTPLLRAARAIATNQLAGAFPPVYMRLAQQTGRGGDVSAAETAAYFWQCLMDLAERLSLTRAELPAYLSGKHVLEYGPGSIPGVALLLLALGARKVTCVDRFPLLHQSAYNDAVLDALAASLGDRERDRLAESIAGFRSRSSTLLEVTLHPQGLSGLVDACDMVISRAVLEEVNDLGATFADMARALVPGGRGVHLVDLRSYGLHRDHPLDFLAPSSRLWRLMYGNKCVPNRHRIGTYLALARSCGLDVVAVERGETLNEAEVEAIRAELAAEFRALPAAELACLTFWLTVEKPAAA